MSDPFQPVAAEVRVEVNLGVLANRINSAYQEYETSVKTTFEKGVEVGRLLNIAKEHVPHGGWADWIAANCHVKIRQAQNLMKVAKNALRCVFEEAPESINEALRQLAPPEEEPITEGEHRLPLSRISIDRELHVRDLVHPEVVSRYADRMKRGDIFPPITVFWEEDGDKLWLVSGFHRVAAAQQAGFKDIMAEIHVGSYAEAAWYACAANKEFDHVGLQLTDADRKRCEELKKEGVGDEYIVAADLCESIRYNLSQAASYIASLSPEDEAKWYEQHLANHSEFKDFPGDIKEILNRLLREWTEGLRAAAAEETP
jgi:hypothetical protein